MENGKYDCPACGERTREKKEHRVCGRCFHQYNEEAGKRLGRGNPDFSLEEWMFPRVKKVLAESKEELQRKRETYQRLRERVKEEAYNAVRETLGERTVPKSQHLAALREKSKVLWRQRGGNRLYAQMKRLEDLIPFLEGILVELSAEFRDKARLQEEASS